MSTHSIVLFGLFYFHIELILKVYSYNYAVADTTKPNDQNAPSPGWIDPFDMSLGSKHSYDEYKLPSIEDYNIDSNMIGWKDARPAHGNKYTNSRSHSHSSDKFIMYQRFVNVLLQALALKDTPEIIGSKLVKLDLVINGRDLKVLQSFGTNGEKGGNVEKVSEIVNEIFRQSQLRSSSFESRLSNMLEWLTKSVVKLISSPEWTITTSLVAMLAATLWLVFVTRSYRLALFFTFFMIFIAGFGLTWMRMYEEEEIKRYYGELVHGDAPYHCKGKSLAWYENVYYYWFGENCLKFYITRDVRPIVKISPTEVLSVTLSTMIIEPAQKIGQAYGHFISEVVGNVSWYLKPMAVILAFIIPPIFTIFVLAFLFKYRLSFSITGVHLIPSWSHRIFHAGKDKYLEDLSRRTDLNSQSKGVIETILADCKSPLVLMNLSAIKSFFSNPSNMYLAENKSAADTNTAETESNETPVESVEEVTKSECVSCKKRTKSIYTCSSGSSSTNEILSSDIAIMAGGDGDQTTDKTESEKTNG